MGDSFGSRLDLKIGGMTCINCQDRIRSRLVKLGGVLGADVRFSDGTARIEYDENEISKEKIVSEIEKLGYKVLPRGESRETTGGAVRSSLLVALVALLFFVLQRTGFLNALSPSADSLKSTAERGAGYALLFLTGLLTSVHCVAMCGGINLSQSLPGAAKNRGLSGRDFAPTLLYNAGRVASYTLAGFVLGAAGLLAGSADGVLLPFSVQGILKIVAGVFMVLMALPLLGIFPTLRKFTPHLPSFLSRKISSARGKNAAPFAVGFLNGFMPCGPLQAMWIVALASGSPLSGALSMLAFSLGTVPLMLGLGSLVTLLGKKFSRVMVKSGAVLVSVMGLLMISQGLALGRLGGGNSAETLATSAGAEQAQSASGGISDGISIEGGKQIVKSTLNPYRYPNITVKRGVPVHWEIDAGEGSLSGCNYRVVFRDLNLAYELGYGKNVIEFTPEKSGKIGYTCWMGMVRGTINVVD